MMVIMGVWFDDFPLDFSRQDTRDSEAVLLAGYPDQWSQTALAQNSGLDITVLPNAPPKYLIREILKRASIAGKLMRLFAEVMRDPQQATAAKSLEPYLVGQEDKLRAAILDHKPSFSLFEKTPPAIELWANGQNPTSLASNLEKTINAAAGFADMAAFVRGLVHVQACVARITVGGKVRGTGFLVGSSLLLTNWHVVSDAGNQQIVAQFDHTANANGEVLYAGREVAFAGAWDVRHSPHADVENAELGANGPPRETNTWDYALLRLSEPVGSQGLGPKATADSKPDHGEVRGALQLVGSQYTFDRQESLLVVGHPFERPMQLSFASPSNVRLTTSTTRIRYDTNTEPGSSGSPVFNKSWRLIGLHHASGPSKHPGTFDVPNGAFNQGIPIEEIVKDLTANVSPDVLVELGLA